MSSCPPSVRKCPPNVHQPGDIQEPESSAPVRTCPPNVRQLKEKSRSQSCRQTTGEHLADSRWTWGHLADKCFTFWTCTLLRAGVVVSNVSKFDVLYVGCFKVWRTTRRIFQSLTYCTSDVSTMFGRTEVLLTSSRRQSGLLFMTRVLQVLISEKHSRLPSSLPLRDG